MLMQDTAAVITGGASGLGEATARLFRASGAQVTILDRDATRGEAVAAEIGAHFVTTDVTSEDSVKAAIAHAVASAEADGADARHGVRTSSASQNSLPPSVSRRGVGGGCWPPPMPPSKTPSASGEKRGCGSGVGGVATAGTRVAPLGVNSSSNIGRPRGIGSTPLAGRWSIDGRRGICRHQPATRSREGGRRSPPFSTQGRRGA